MASQKRQGYDPSVHVYGSGRVFVVVPRVQSDEGEWVEVTPVEKVNITLGRSVVAPLTQALREGKARSSVGLVGLQNQEDIWDGDGGRWWNHRLLCVRITWSQAHIRFAPQPKDPEGLDRETLTEIMPGNLPEVKIATRLVEYLGQQLEVS
jgi:hypothetical protein